MADDKSKGKLIAGIVGIAAIVGGIAKFKDDAKSIISVAEPPRIVFKAETETYTVNMYDAEDISKTDAKPTPHTLVDTDHLDFTPTTNLTMSKTYGFRTLLR